MKVSITWVIWLITSLFLLLSTRNPINILITLLSLFILGNSVARKMGQKKWTIQNLRFLSIMMIISTLINMLFTHTGQSILITLPKNWPLVGGPITFESMVYGAINGLIIGSLYLLFNIFNLALSIKQITRLIPNAFRPIAIMITISLTFFPSIQTRTREIREAQMIRGNPMRKVSDWLPIIIPLLITSLEHAFLLSESMASRGFHAKSANKNSRIYLATMVLALFAFFAGWVFQLYSYPQGISFVLYGTGFGIMILVLFMAGKHVKVTHLHREVWHQQDKLYVLIKLLIVTILLSLQFFDRSLVLPYSPYPKLSVPHASILGAIFSFLPGLPLIFQNHD